MKAAGCYGTITLEVFTEDRHYVEHSRDILQQYWEETAPQPAEVKRAPALA